MHGGIPQFEHEYDRAAWPVRSPFWLGMLPPPGNRSFELPCVEDSSGNNGLGMDTLGNRLPKRDRCIRSDLRVYAFGGVSAPFPLDTSTYRLFDRIEICLDKTPAGCR